MRLLALFFISIAFFGCSKKPVAITVTTSDQKTEEVVAAQRVCIEKIACYTDANFNSEFNNEGFVAKVNSSIKSLASSKLREAGFIVEEEASADTANWYLDIACACAPKGFGYKLIIRIRGYPHTFSKYDAPCLFEVMLEGQIDKLTKDAAKKAASEVADEFLKFFIDRAKPK